LLTRRVQQNDVVHPAIQEADINPIVVYRLALDAVIVVG
jgi:hypothetical protein